MKSTLAVASASLLVCLLFAVKVRAQDVPGEEETPPATDSQSARAESEPLPSSGGPSSAPPSEPVEKTTPEATKIIRLRFTVAGELSEMLVPLFEDSGVTMVPDERTNSLLVRGPESRVFNIVALVLNLDREPPPAGQATPPAAQTPDAAGGTSPASSDDDVRTKTIKIFTLQYAKASELRGMLRQVFREKNAAGNQSIELVADERTNLLIVRADEKNLLAIEAIVERLDETLAKPDEIGQPETNVGRDTFQSAPSEAADVAKLQDRLTSLDREVAQLAAEYRHAQSGSSPDEPTAQKAADELRARVAALFEARQAVQRAELAELRARLDHVERQIEARERVREQIIERRVQELLQGGAAAGSPSNDPQANARPSPDAGGPAADRAQQAVGSIRQLRGTWLAIKQGRDGKMSAFKQPYTLTFRENQYEFREGGGEPYSAGTFRVGHVRTEGRPAFVELHRSYSRLSDSDIVRGDTSQVATEYFAVEHVVNQQEILRMWSLPGLPTAIPDEFLTKPNDGRLLMVYRRISDEPLSTQEHQALSLETLLDDASPSDAPPEE